MNKRHYEHTLPNIRGSLSNTYSLPTLGLSVTIAIIFFFLLMFRTVRNGTERELYLLFPGQTAASSF